MHLKPNYKNFLHVVKNCKLTSLSWYLEERERERERDHEYASTSTICQYKMSCLSAVKDIAVSHGFSNLYFYVGPRIIFP